MRIQSILWYQVVGRRHMRDNKHFYGSVTVGERGQIVVPAEARTDLGIEPGEKLLVFGGRNGLKLMKADKVAEFLDQAMEHLGKVREAVQDE